MIAKQFEFNTDCYQQSLLLRERILRKPLGLMLTAQDVNKEDKQLHFGLFEKHTLLACVLFKPINSSVIKLRQMAVDESLQGQGLGRKLIQFAEKNVKGLGFDEIEMAARDSAIKFYQHLGYQTTGEIFEQAGVPHIKMYKMI